MNGFMVPKAIEGLRVEACQAFTSSMLEVSILFQAIATATALAVAGRDKLMLARTSEFKATLDSLLMVNAHAVTQHWNQRHLQANSCRVQQTFKALGVDLKKMLPHKSIATLVSGWTGLGEQIFAYSKGSIDREAPTCREDTLAADSSTMPIVACHVACRSPWLGQSTARPSSQRTQQR